MKIFEINSGNYGSTGNIMLNIAETARLSGHSVRVAYRQSRSVTANEKEDEIQIGNSFYGLTHRIIGEYLGLEGFGSVISTLKLIKQIKEFNPDVIHLHILHGMTAFAYHNCQKRHIRVVLSLREALYHLPNTRSFCW